MPGPPVITVGAANGATTISSSVLKLPTSSEFRILGGPLVQIGDARFWSPQSPYTNGVAAYTLNPWFASFVHEGSQFEIVSQGFAGSQFRLWVNEQLAYTIPTAPTADGSQHLTLVDFTTVGGRARQRIVIEYAPPSAGTSNAFFFGGIRIGPTDTLAPDPAQLVSRLIVVGDSLTYGQGATYRSDGWPWRMGRQLGLGDIWPSGMSGTGVIATNSGSGAKFRDRLATDVYPYSPSVVIIQGSTNDSGLSGIQAECQLLLKAIKTNLPATRRIVTGLMSPQNFSAGWTTVQAALKAAALAEGVSFIDTTSPVLWAAGTGRVGGTTGDGNADYYLESGVGVHPTDAGHTNIGDRMAVAVGAILGVAVG